MTEYLTFETEPTDDPDVRLLITNQTLTPGDDEIYADRDAGDTGSPLAQTLFHAVDGLHALEISEDTLVVTRAEGVPWEMLLDEIRDALRDFYL